MEATPSDKVESEPGEPPPPARRSRRIGLVLAALVVLFAFWFVPLHRILLLRFRPPATTAFIEARKARFRAEGKDDRIERTPVPLDKVSRSLVDAVIAAEDARFYSHHGIDWEAVREARAYNEKQLKRRHPRLHGASTITQQLAKNLFLSGERNLFRKGREALIAYALELVLSKRQILAHYLSAIEWGDRVYGCEAAARRYFGVSASRLTLDQAAWLAAMIPGPQKFLSHPDRLARRAARIARYARAGTPEPVEIPEDEDPGD